MIKLAFYGKSGVGKSTSSEIVKKYFEEKSMTFDNIKLALPLYEIQQHYYKIAGNDIDFYQQNQGLLEDIATYLRKLNYSCLTDNFDKRLKESTADVVINDDVRDTVNDFPYLKEQGFKLIKIECDETVRVERLKKRNDLDIVLNSKTTHAIDTVAPDYVINTSNTNTKDLEKILTKYLNTLCN